jgi:hypothetical protein
MKRLFTFFIITILVSNSSIAQVTEGEKTLRTVDNDTLNGWKRGGVFALNLAQASLTNWAAGGENSFAVNGMVSMSANYKGTKDVWNNSLDIGYGLLKQGKKAGFMKTDDKIDFLSKYGRQFYKKLYYAALLNFKTQMTAGYNYPNDSVPISNLLAPGYLLGALGIDLKPNSYFSLFAAPVTMKTTIVNDQKLADAGAFGVDKATYDDAGIRLTKGKFTRSEFGGYVRVIYSRNKFNSEFLKNVAFTTKADFFSNYLKNPQNIDVSWETLIAFKVNKYISVNINTVLLYDDDVNIAVDNNGDNVIDEYGPRAQFKEILGVGFSYKF